jgi:hypothetical protein
MASQTKDKDALDRQRKLSELCRGVLKDFVGRVVTPYLVAEAEGKVREALDDAIRAGTYVLPEGLVLGRVEVGDDLRIKVYFEWKAGRFDGVASEIDDMTNRGPT